MTNGIPTRPIAPKFTRLTGEALWSAVLGRYELEQHELLILREIVRCVDDLDRLAAITGRQGAITASGDIHPAVAEARQMRITLATLIGALRLPDENEEEPASVRRPRRYATVRSIDSPAPQTGSVRIEARNDDSPPRELRAALGDRAVTSGPQIPRDTARSAGPPAPPPVGRQFNPAPAARSSRLSPQLTVTELIAKVRGGDNSRPIQSTATPPAAPLINEQPAPSGGAYTIAPQTRHHHDGH